MEIDKFDCLQTVCGPLSSQKLTQTNNWLKCRVADIERLTFLTGCCSNTQHIPGGAFWEISEKSLDMLGNRSK